MLKLGVGKELWLYVVLAVCCAVGARSRPGGAQPLPRPSRGAVAEPWPRRAREEPPASLQPPFANGEGPRRNTIVNAWPIEPESPTVIDAQRFAQALGQLCARPDAERLAPAILSAAEEFHVDAFLLAGLADQQSHCRPEYEDASGIGLTRISLSMFQRGMRQGSYFYGKPVAGASFEQAQLVLGRYPFTAQALRNPKVNVYFAAALLSVFEQQCPAIDARFGSVPHRHHVSHYVFGDRVRSNVPEAKILIARRRLLEYYAPSCAPPLAQVGDVALSSPLDAPTRLVIGQIGEPRDNGKRIHLGIDLAADDREPVRAMAPGEVTFAGVDMAQRGQWETAPTDSMRMAAQALGPRGLYVRLRHADGVETLYVHLASFNVQAGQRLERAEEIGRIGRSGVHASEPHLHLGIFVDGLPIDPLPALREYAVGLTRVQSRFPVRPALGPREARRVLQGIP